jgi:hypothetical protein
MKHRELQDALKGRGTTCAYGNEHPRRGKPILATMCRALLKSAIAQDGALAHAVGGGIGGLTAFFFKPKVLYREIGCV